MFETADIFIRAFILLYFVSLNGFYSVLTIIAQLDVWYQYKRTFIDNYFYFYSSKMTPPVSILVPAYNEENTIVETVASLLNLRYPTFEVIVINDGSSDSTLEKLTSSFNLQKTAYTIQTCLKTKSVRGVYRQKSQGRLIVVDKLRGGKADALNAGINTSRSPYFISIDADVIMEEDSLLRIMKPLLENPRMNKAAGGIVRVANGCVEEGGRIKDIRLARRPIEIFQTLEYIRAFTAGRAGLSKLNSLMIVSGAFGAYEIEFARKVGGYSKDTVGEDMELLVRLHRHFMENKIPYRVFFRAYPVCWTEVPETAALLGKQRKRWYQGLGESLFRHKIILFNPDYRSIGLFGAPFFFLFEFLGPVIESAGYLYLLIAIIFGFIDWSFFFVFLALAILWGTVLSLSAVIFEDLNFKWFVKLRYIAVLTLFALFENLGYRQLTVYWRIKGLFSYLRGRREWEVVKHQGLEKPSVSKIAD